MATAVKARKRFDSDRLAWYRRELVIAAGKPSDPRAAAWQFLGREWVSLVACRFSQVVLKCRDVEVVARFWCEVLEYVELDREGTTYIEIGPRAGFGGPQPTIFLIHNDEPKHERSRLHIDVNPTDRDQAAELERLLAAGAKLIDIGQPADASWHVLADPEDNEFCLLKTRLDPL